LPLTVALEMGFCLQRIQ